MSLHQTFTDAERAALKLHGLLREGPSQLADAFVLGMRYAIPEGHVRVPFKPTPAMVEVMLDWGTKRSEWEMILRAANPSADGVSVPDSQPKGD